MGDCTKHIAHNKIPMNTIKQKTKNVKKFTQSATKYYLKLPKLHKDAFTPPHICTAGTPMPMADANSKKHSTKKKRYGYDWFSNVMDADHLTDAQIRTGLEIFYKKQNALAIPLEQGVYSFFEPNAKGTERYSLKTSTKIRDIVKEISKGKRDIVMSTLTIDPSKFFNNIRACWIAFHDYLPKFLKNLREYFSAWYVDVFESTYKGLPHLHLIISAPKGTVGGFDACGKKKILKRGHFQAYIRRHWGLGFCDIRLADAKGAAGYVAKYMSKGFTNELKNEIRKEGPMKKSVRKEAIALLATTSLGIRQWGSTRLATLEKAGVKLDDTTIRNCRKLKAQSQKSQYYDEMVDKVQERIEDFIFGSDIPIDPQESAKATLNDLIKICNNYRFCPGHLIWMGRKEMVESELGISLNEGAKKDYEEIKKVREKMNFLGCKGCFYMDLYRIIIGKVRPSFMWRVYDDAGYGYFAFTKDAYNDPLGLINRIYGFICAYQENIEGKGLPYKKFLETGWARDSRFCGGGYFYPNPDNLDYYFGDDFEEDF